MLYLVTNRNGNITYINVMYDMTQFVIVVSVPNKIVTTLTEHIMQHIHLKFAIRHLTILDGSIAPSKVSLP